jgi:hypothetical protein
MRERRLAAVPRPVIALLTAALLAQIAWQATRPAPAARADALAPPYPAAVVRVLSGNDGIAAAQVNALYLQAFDNQPGISVPFRDLDYGLVERWLDGMLVLDSRTQYPMMLASQLYAQVPNTEKQRVMLDFVHRKFLADPERRWRWLAHVTIMAKHRLRDLPRALRYADDIARRPPRPLERISSARILESASRWCCWRVARRRRGDRSPRNPISTQLESSRPPKSLFRPEMTSSAFPQ